MLTRAHSSIGTVGGGSCSDRIRNRYFRKSEDQLLAGPLLAPFISEPINVFKRTRSLPVLVSPNEVAEEAVHLDAETIVQRSIGRVFESGNPQHERLRLQAIEAQSQNAAHPTRENMLDTTVDEKVSVQKAHYRRFSSEARGMGKKKSFATPADFLKYQRMAKDAVRGHVKSLKAVVPVGFSLPEEKRPVLKKRTEPQFDLMSTQDLKHSLYLSNQERLMLRMPVRFKSDDREGGSFFPSIKGASSLTSSTFKAEGLAALEGSKEPIHTFKRTRSMPKNVRTI